MMLPLSHTSSKWFFDHTTEKKQLRPIVHLNVCPSYWLECYPARQLTWVNMGRLLGDVEDGQIFSHSKQLTFVCSVCYYLKRWQARLAWRLALASSQLDTLPLSCNRLCEYPADGTGLRSLVTIASIWSTVTSRLPFSLWLNFHLELSASQSFHPCFPSSLAHLWTYTLVVFN